MKLIIAVINHDDAKAVNRALSRNGFSCTVLATTGGFLMAGNDTFLIGVEEDKIQPAIDIIKKTSHSRKQFIPASAEMGQGYCLGSPVEVTVGGATIFVVDVEHFEHV